MAQIYKYSLEFRQLHTNTRKGQLIFGNNAPDNKEIFSSFESIPTDVGDNSIDVWTDGEKSIYITNIKYKKTVAKIKRMMGRAPGWKVILQREKIKCSEDFMKTH